MIEIAKYILADKEEKRLKRERLKEFLSGSGTANMYNLFTEDANMIPSLAKAVASSGINYVGDKVNNIFNPMIPAITGAKNFMGFEGTPETRDQEEFMTNLIRDKVLNSGSLTGSIDYTDYGSATADHPSGDWTGGYFGPEFAYGTTLGKADYSVDSETGKVNWTGGTDYDFPEGWLGNEFIENTVNTGGFDNMTGGQPQQYTPNINIPARDMMNIFSGGKRVHMDEPVTKPTTKDAFTGKQLADSLAMDAQLIYGQVPNYPKPTPETVPFPDAPPPRRTSDAALAQIQANIAAAKTKSTVLPKPVKATPLSGPAGYSRPTTQSASPTFKSYGPPNRQRY